MADIAGNGSTSTVARLDRLMGYLDHDPDNLALLLDTADAALGERQTDLALQLLERHAHIASLPPHGLHLMGTAKLQAGDFAGAEAVFAGLVANGQRAPGLVFNLAWARAMLGDHAGALALLDADVLASAPRAPMLKVRMLHHLGRLDEALSAGAELIAHHPGDGDLAGALSLVAMDAEQPAAAAHYAGLGQGHADACCTLGMLALGAQDPGGALPLFDRALAQRAAHPHAWLGHGLARLAQGDVTTAATELEKAATLFDRHIGSWIAAGWAWYACANLHEARRCFERALAIDDAFAESHGALAVLDFAQGHIADARRRAEIAIRLNRQCFGGALAMSLLAEHDNNPALAQKIRDRALQVPIGPGGMTIATAMLSIGQRGARH